MVFLGRVILEMPVLNGKGNRNGNVIPKMPVLRLKREPEVRFDT